MARHTPHTTNTGLVTTVPTMIMMRRLFSLAGLLALLVATAMAFDESQYPDSKENRIEQAKRVLEGTPIEETLAGIIDEAARVKGEETANVRPSVGGSLW